MQACRAACSAGSAPVGLDQVRLRKVGVALRDVDLALLKADLCRRNGDLRAGLRNPGAGEVDLRAIFGIVDLVKNLAFLHRFHVGDGDPVHVTGHARAQRRRITAEIGVIGALDRAEQQQIVPVHHEQAAGDHGEPDDQRADDNASQPVR